MKRIAAVESFFSPEHRAAIEKAAAECGFSVDYFTQGHLPADQAADYEIIYGMCPPQELKAAANLKWLCCSFAGVDAYTDETIYPNRRLRYYHLRAHPHGDADDAAADAEV